MYDPTKTYNGNPNLKGAGAPINFTAEQIQEYMKCAKDPIYFAQKYINIVHVDHGLIQIDMYDYQKTIANAIHKNRRVCVNTSRQAGKCVHINTPIKVRNKKTGEVFEMAIGEFYEKQKINVKDAD